MKPELFNALKEEAKKFFSDSKGSHDWEHTIRVYRLCMHIGKAEGADLSILELSAIFHDIGRAEQDRSRGLVCHAEKGASRARSIMEKHGIDEETIFRVIKCIRSHRFRGREKPSSLEEKVLFDADKLDSIGAVGIGRAFLFAGEVGARLHDRNVSEKDTSPYSREDTAYREFKVKLCRIKDSMLTPEGRRMAEERHSFMVEFFDRINMEMDGVI